mmetsp:Transcript_38005/g.104526  ORF Transcript_38005/g.104526 Transcript_38005/m.104526 type:complete len:104 (+) Transcript_38005:446-757(+)
MNMDMLLKVKVFLSLIKKKLGSWKLLVKANMNSVLFGLRDVFPMDQSALTLTRRALPHFPLMILKIAYIRRMSSLSHVISDCILKVKFSHQMQNSLSQMFTIQ